MKRTFCYLFILAAFGCDGGSQGAHDPDANNHDRGGFDTGEAAAGDSRAAAVDTTTAVGFCLRLTAVVCEQAFACSPSAASSHYGTLDKCEWWSETCRSEGPAPCPHGYNRESGAMCVVQTTSLACGDFVGGVVPASCQAACPAAQVETDAGTGDASGMGKENDAHQDELDGWAIDAEFERDAVGISDARADAGLDRCDAGLFQDSACDDETTILH